MYVVASRQVRPLLQMPVVPLPVPMLVAAQQGWPVAPHGMQAPVVDWTEQYVLGAVHT